MRNIWLLVAHEHRSSRDVLAAAIQQLRPGIKIMTLEPEQLDAALLRIKPKLVVCSRVTEGLEASGSDWILLYPDGEHRIEQRIDGTRGTAKELKLSDLLTYIDRVIDPLVPSKREWRRIMRRSGVGGCLK